MKAAPRNAKQAKMQKAFNGEGCIRFREWDRRWEAKFSVEDPLTGRIVTQSFYSSDVERGERVVAKKMIEAQKKVASGLLAQPTQITVHQWLDEWLEHHNNNIRDSTKVNYRRVVETNIKRNISADLKLHKFRPLNAQRFINNLAETHKASTVHTIVAIFSCALNAAKRMQILESNPLKDCILPKSKPSPMHVFQDGAELQAFLYLLRGRRYERLYCFALFTGMRQGEILGLQWDDIDFDKHAITVNRQMIHSVARTTELFGVPKNGKPRTIALGKAVSDILRKQRSWQNEQRMLFGSVWQNQYNLVFTQPDGRYLNALSVYESFKRLAKKAGHPEFRFHDLRHNYAVFQLQAGVDIKTIQDSLGHASAKFTMDVYMAATAQMKYNGADKFDEFIYNNFKIS